MGVLSAASRENAAVEARPGADGIADALSKELKRRGFRFVGTTICYAFMQAVGIVNDHATDCFRYGRPEMLDPQVSPSRSSPRS